jgi:hypothetical protein
MGTSMFFEFRSRWSILLTFEKLMYWQNRPLPKSKWATSVKTGQDQI